MADNGNLKKGNPDTQFTSGRVAVEMGRKGGYARAAQMRKKNALRKNLKWMLAVKPELDAKQKANLKKSGYDPDAEYTVEDLITIGLIQRAMKDDRSVDSIYRYLEEDPLTILEEKRLKVQQEAVAAIKNSDGFMEAMGATVGEVFEDGGDTPDTLEDE